MDSDSVLKLARKHIPNFVGVFALDKLPDGLRPPANFIVNTDTHNLPGEHWLAVSYQKAGIVYVFDSFGFFYPRFLKLYLNRLRRISPVMYNRIHYQGIREKTCALYCIAWLITMNQREKNETV